MAIRRAPQVNDRVYTKVRMKAGVKTEDYGVITRLEDGGYCVVRWDSDDEETSVVMMSLFPEGHIAYGRHQV